MRDLITIIVPIYKVEQYIRRCVESLLTQTYQNIEIILVDDGSPDRCGEICDGYALQDSRITVIHKENGGLSDARNAGIDAANGTYLMFVDSDDYIDPAMVATMYSAVQSAYADLVICNFLRVCDGEKTDPDEKDLPIQNEVIDQKEAIGNRIFSNRGYWAVACNKLYRRSIFSDLRFPKGKVHEDEFVLHAVLLQCSRIACIAQPLYYYEQRENSITGRKLTISRLDAVEALINRADALVACPCYLIPALRSLKDAASLFHYYYDMYGDTPDSIHKNRNKELQKQYRAAYKKFLPYKKELCANKLFIRASLDAISMYRWGKIESLIRRVHKTRPKEFSL